MPATDSALTIARLRRNKAVIHLAEAVRTRDISTIAAACRQFNAAHSACERAAPQHQN